MKVYTTKYALTAGIEVLKVEQGRGDQKYVYRKVGALEQFVMGRNAFLTYEEAAVAAREMRAKKGASLRKQLTKVSGLLFPTMEPENLKNT